MPAPGPLWPVKAGSSSGKVGCLAELHRPSTSANHSSAAKTAPLKPRVPATVSDPPAARTNTSPSRRHKPWGRVQRPLASASHPGQRPGLIASASQGTDQGTDGRARAARSATLSTSAAGTDRHRFRARSPQCQHQHPARRPPGPTPQSVPSGSACPARKSPTFGGASRRLAGPPRNSSPTGRRASSWRRSRSSPATGRPSTTGAGARRG